MLTPEQAGKILSLEQPTVTLVKRGNDVYRISAGADTFFLKTYTKDWYGDDRAGTAFCVDHEAAAWQVLREHGLSAPDVIVAEMGCANPLERPFIVTRALRGQSLTDLLHAADKSQFKALLRSVGVYMRTMHNITFTYPGYITSAGLNTPLDPNAWQHYIWTAERFKQEALRVWDELPVNLAVQVNDFYATHEADLRAAYQLPRFIHGDCHAHQFFIDGDQVSGVVDMEVSSGGNPAADLLKFCLEMVGAFPAQRRWWEAFFDGYGEVAFDQFRLWLLAAHHINFKVVNWPGTWPQIVRHVLDGEDWLTLFSLADLANQVD